LLDAFLPQSFHIHTHTVISLYTWHASVPPLSNTVENWPMRWVSDEGGST
jgi:hypothetical protein